MTEPSTDQTPPPRQNAETVLREIFSHIAAPLAAIESRISASALDFEPELRELVTYVAGSQGKRLRPALTLLAAEASGGILPAHNDLAVVLELIHIATLVHDDIMDGATVRRGNPTANTKWGNAVSVLLGDSLFAHALTLSTNFDDREVTRHIAHAASQVCAGEIIQTRRRFDLALGLSEYFRIIEMKTAALFEAATRLAARLNSQPGPVVEALGSYGSRLGAAYQIYDDCLDLVGDEQTALKSLGTDFAKGKLTLPLLIALKEAEPARRERLEQLINKADPADSAEVRSLVSATGALSAATAAAGRFLSEASSALAVLPASPSKDRLRSVPEAIRLLLEDLTTPAAADNPVARAA